MRNKIIFSLVVIGIIGAAISAYVYAVPTKPLPPAFTPATNPYAKGIFANGIVESFQPNGVNTNIYPEVPGTITHIEVSEGQIVSKGTVLVSLDDSIQRATTEQQQSQAESALALLNELKAQPRRENLDVARAQMELAAANLKSAQDQLNKQQRSYDIAPESVSKDTLDNAINGAKVGQANLEVAKKQYDLLKAGAWRFDIANQEKQHAALVKASTASMALLGKYTIRAPTDGIVMSIGATVGSYVSPQGAYDSYTQGYDPIVVMGTSKQYLSVRCYIDEILIPRLPSADKIKAEMTIRGSDVKIPLTFVRVQPYVSPKIQLSNQRQEKVDVRVLPVLFRFEPPAGTGVYPGELVDVYIGER